MAGYTARRMVGPAEFRVAVTRDKERVEDVGGPGYVLILDLSSMEMLMLNPKSKTVTAMPQPPKPTPPPKQGGVERFIDREQAPDGLVTVSMGFKTPQGKEWMVQTICRSDGIWVERKNKTPQGLVTAVQRDIKVEAIPAFQFELPSGYKMVKPKK